MLYVSEENKIRRRRGRRRPGKSGKTAAQKTVVAADQHGDRKTLQMDAYIPATMAAIYLLLLLYFKSIGGYKPTSIDMEKITGGIDGPMEA